MNQDHHHPVQRQEDRGALAIIRDIKNRTLDPKLLSTDDRRECVDHLMTEGLTAGEMVQILNVSDRTIARDRKAIQEANAIEHDPNLAGQFAGRLVAEAETCISRIRRVTRDKNAPHAVKVDGEKGCYQILSDLSARLQSLGYLPSAAQRIQADLTHSIDGPNCLAEIRSEIDRLEPIEREVRGIIDAEVKHTKEEQSQSQVTTSVHQIGDPS